jgi:hypothetical protein
MRVLRRSLVFSALCAALLGSARADSEWQSVSLADGVGMDVPAVVKNFRPEAGDPDTELAYFDVDIEDEGDLFCMLQRLPYGGDNISRETALVKLGSGGARAFCQEEGKDISGWEANDWDSRSVDGVAGGSCSAAYTDAGDKDQPGTVETALLAAGRNHLFGLTCKVSQTDKDEAIASYVATWEDIIKHVQDSLRLPDSEK